ncbi:peptidylprolyl isomerase [Escherichia coli]
MKVTLHTSHGDIVVQLHDDQVPGTVENFLAYCRDGFYDGTIFHRVIPEFVLQCGGYEAGMKAKPAGEPIKNEANNGLKNKRGTVAMARTQQPNSATSQFFINLVDNDFLDYTGESIQGYGYCVFGEVILGMDVIDEIANVETGSTGIHRDVPLEDITINSVDIE